MSLPPSSRIGPYEIIALIGSGGMGEVYRARDTKLARTVALKILPDVVARDPDRRERFEREAKTLASLNHAHIAQIYGFEEGVGNGVAALAMEFVPGEDLGERVKRGPLSIDETVTIARQIADGLEAAHDYGIVHRDLKPANIKVRPDGTVKILDFGLAKDTTQGGDGRSLTNSPTVPAVTAAGILLGTASYMSPEQARGHAVDARTDVWAFGCVVYELLTGHTAFGGDSVADIMSAVISREPEWTALPAETPASLRRMLRRCLEKDRRQRLRHIGDARLDLDERAIDPAPVAPHAAPPAALLGRASWLGAGVLLASIAFLAPRWWRTDIADATGERVLQRITAEVGLEESPALSPDGRSVAYVARVNGVRQVWVRLLSGGAPLQLTRDDADHRHPRWAPDSAAIVYFVADRTAQNTGTLWEIPALGGSPRRLLSSYGGGDISHDGTRLATFRVTGDQPELVVAARDGSGVQRIAMLPKASVYSYPRWSPDDRSIAFQRLISTAFDERLYVVDATAGAGEPRQVAQAADMTGLAWLGDSERIIFSSAQGSTLLYPPTMNLRVVRRDGADNQPATFGDSSYTEPDVHPVAGVVVSRGRSQADVWKIPIGGAAADNVLQAVRLTRQTGVAQVATIGSDEAEVAFLSDSGGHANLWAASTDGSRIRQLTFETDPAVSVGVPVWSPTSNLVAVLLTRGGLATQWLIATDGGDRRELVRDAYWASWSPDGRWLYYVTSDPFRIEKIAVEGGAPVGVRTDDAASPSVGADGTLYFAVPLRGGAPFDWEVRKARPESAPATTLARVNGGRVPVDDINIHPIVSPDGRWLVQPLIDGATSNLWLIDTQSGALHRATDFGDRVTLIARRVAWSRDSRFIYAAIADIDSDVVLLKNLVR